jgi:mono/diheme cytochrome c family protein
MNLNLLILIFLFCHGVEAKRIPESKKLIERGAVVFQNNCIRCHGEKGLGDGKFAKIITGAKPRNFTTGYFRRGYGPEQIFKTISNGSEGTAMPAWAGEISENDRWALVYFVRSLKLKENKFTKIAP